MKLDSVRSLKAQLMSENLWRSATKPRSPCQKPSRRPVKGKRDEMLRLRELLISRGICVSASKTLGYGPSRFGMSRSLTDIELRAILASYASQRRQVEQLRQVSSRPSELGSSSSLAPRRRIPLAIGISGRPGSYKLAVRLQDIVPGIQTVVDGVRQRARGEVEVRTVGRVFKQAPWRRRRNRPLRIGGSIGHTRVKAGTLGCFVAPADSEDAQELILSNNHVLADENKAKKGASIVQPASADGGQAGKDRVGSLVKFVRLRKRHNLVDAAVADLVEGVEYYYEFLEGLGSIRGVRTDLPEIGEVVYKVGRTTGLTKGRISAVEMDALWVDYDMGSLQFDQQLEIEPAGKEPFSLSGDSGSLIVDSRRKAIGLLFAGNDADATYANPIGQVLDSLKMKLVY